MPIYEVGKLYHPDKSRWQQGVQFNLRGGQAELLLFFESPGFHETLAIKKGECEFGVVAIDGVIFFLYRFGSEIPWSDQPFSIHLVPETERIIPVLPNDETRLLMQIMLVDAKTGILKAMRAVTLAPEFSAELLKLVGEQSKKTFDQSDYDGQIAEIYRKYPETKNLVKECFVFSEGGV